MAGKVQDSTIGRVGRQGFETGFRIQKNIGLGQRLGYGQCLRLDGRNGGIGDAQNQEPV